MIVEPVPTDSRSKRRRTLGRLAVLVPLVLLAVVVGVGVLGRASTPPKPTTADQQQVPDTSPESSAAASETVPATTPAPRRPPFPVSIDGLTVKSIPTLLATLTDTRPGSVIAVAGYLGVTDPPTDCGDGIDPLGPLCERMALFAETPWTLRGSEGFTGLGPHLHPRVPIGIHLPAAIADTTTAAGGSPMSAVIIGRLSDTPEGNCGPVLANCEVGFDLDAVAWVSGSPFGVQPFIGPQIDAIARDWVLSNQQAAEALAVGPSGIVISTALVRPATLRTLDPKAARIVRRDPPPGLVWYIRGVSRSLFRGATETLVWAVVDDVNLRILAKGVEGGAPTR
ncbi:MAG TPA: hypothetical protein VIZ22_13695 [Candidatus Limnocylindrales bacterium]